jgi:hypothetical protein
MPLTNAVQSSVSSHSRTSGNLRITTTTTTTTQLLEVFHLSRLFTVDGANGKVETLVVDSLQKGLHTMGNTAALFAPDAIYFPGRIKANKGKEIVLVKVPYR